MAQLPIVSGSLVQSPSGGVKMDGGALRQSAFASGTVGQAIGNGAADLFGGIGEQLQQNFNAQQIFKADIGMREAKDQFTADLVNMPDPGTWLPAWKEKANSLRDSVLNDPKNGPAVKRHLSQMFGQWEQSTTAEVNIQALRKQVSDTTATAKVSAGMAAQQGDLATAMNTIDVAIKNHADPTEMRNFAAQLPGIAAKSQALLLVDSDPGNAPELLRKNPEYLKAMGPVVFNSVLGAAHEKQSQFFSDNYNNIREEMRAAGGIKPEVLQEKVKANLITQRMADGLSNLMETEENRNDQDTYNFARTMVQDHDWENDQNPQKTKEQFLGTFPIKNNKYHYALTQSLDAAITKAKKKDQKEEQPVKAQIFKQLSEDRNENGYTTPSYEEVQKGGWKIWPFTREPDTKINKFLLGGLSALQNPNKVPAEDIEKFYGKGVTREQVIRAEQDKYNTIQEKMRQWFDDPKNKDADYDTAVKYLRDLEKPYVFPAASELIKKSTGQKEQAMQWIMAHPNDPRIPAIKAKLGIK